MTLSAQSAFAAALLDAGLPPPEGLTTHNGSSVEQRFAVYRNNVMISLIDALAAGFPVVQSLVGTEFFQAMARVFVAAHPPTSRIMSAYGAAFPAFIADFSPAASMPFLADVARLERARTDSYHSANAEPVSASDFAALPPESFGETLCIFLPSVQIVAAETAIFSIWAAHHGALDLAEVDPFQPESVLIARPELDVEVSRLAPGAAPFFTTLQGRATIAAAADAALAATPDFDLTAAVQTLIASRCVAWLLPPVKGSDNAV